MLLSELQISDGQILKVESSLSSLNLVFKDWKDQEWSIIFRNPLAIQSFSIEGEELSHIEILSKDVFKDATMEFFSDEKEEYFWCFSFYGVWCERPLLKIIAKDNYEIISSFGEPVNKTM